MTKEEKTFIQSIWENRYVKFTVPYVIGAWGFIQVAAFLESRYQWAKNWPDFILVFSLIMLPSVLLFSYFRGKKSEQLVKTEKIFLPANFILALVLAFFALGKEDTIKNTASKVSVVNEEGQTVERVVPHVSSIKRVVLLPWDNEIEDEVQNWIGFGLPILVEADLEQDTRVIAISPQSLSEEMQEYNIKPDQKIPFAIKRKIAVDNYSDYFLEGKLSQTEDNYELVTTLYSTKDGKPIYSKEYTNSNPIEMVDNISQDFRKEVYVENELQEDFVDLPASNLYTSSLEALKAYTLGVQASSFQRNMATAISQIQTAISLDPNFAIAYATLSNYLLSTNQMKEAKEASKKAMQLEDMLSEPLQFVVKHGYMKLESPPKAIALLEMWSQIYPKDYTPYSYLISSYRQNGQAEKALLTAQRAHENGHSGSLLLTLASLENAMGNLQEAKKYYDQFEKEFPNKIKDTFGKGNLYMAQGDFSKAKEHFEKLLLLDPDKANIISKLAEIEGHYGNFDRQLELLDEALKNEKQFVDSLTILQKKELVYLNLGRIETYFEEMEKRWQISTRVAPLDQLRSELLAPYNVEALINQGKENVLEELLAISSRLDKSIIDFDCVAEGNYYIFSNDAENLNASMDSCLAVFKKIQSAVQVNIVYAFIAKVNGDYAKAVEYVEEVQNESGLSDANLHMFAEFYRLNEDYQKAEQKLKDGLKINPFNPKLLYQLALSYQAQGKKKEAKEAVQKAIDIWKNADANYKPALLARELAQNL